MDRTIKTMLVQCAGVRAVRALRHRLSTAGGCLLLAATVAATVGFAALLVYKGTSTWPYAELSGVERQRKMNVRQRRYGSDSTKDASAFVPGEVIVKFRNAADAEGTMEALVETQAAVPRAHVPITNRLKNTLRHHRAKIGKKVFATTDRRTMGKSRQKGRAPSAAVDATEEETLAKFVKIEVEEKTAEATLDFIKALQALPEVDVAEPNYLAQTFLFPNDSYYDGAWGQPFRDLWGLQNIQAAPAWDLSQGNGIVVAVTDTGIDSTHDDITANMWENPGEAGKCTNGVDDDNNGYVDDCGGWDFHNGDNNPMDGFGHGTHVAGTIAAIGNNAKGIVGVSPMAKVMAIKGLGDDGRGVIDRLAQAIVYAANNGAMVINASWGCRCPASQVLRDAVDYAHDVKDVVFVAAAGNSNADVGTPENGFAPASLPAVITVAASDHLDQKASFSNYGNKIDVTAPGGGDTDPTDGYQPYRSILSLKSSLANSGMTGNGQLVVGRIYLRQAGTSMAAPHVAGVAALVRALHPEFSAEQVRSAIRLGADDVGPPGFDVDSGYGRVNALRALRSTPLPSSSLSSSSSPSASGSSLSSRASSASGSSLSSLMLSSSALSPPSSPTSSASSSLASSPGSSIASLFSSRTFSSTGASLSSVGPASSAVSSIAASSSPSSVLSGCTDTDGGNVSAVKGLVSGPNFYQEDYCNNSLILQEYYCMGDRSMGAGYRCQCSNGACVGPLPADCVDSDGGNNTAVQGTVETTGGTVRTDFCYAAGTLVEYACAGDRYSETLVPCVCTNGACPPP